jgi:hypothetical protein
LPNVVKIFQTFVLFLVIIAKKRVYSKIVNEKCLVSAWRNSYFLLTFDPHYDESGISLTWGSQISGAVAFGQRQHSLRGNGDTRCFAHWSEIEARRRSFLERLILGTLLEQTKFPKTRLCLTQSLKIVHLLTQSKFSR